MEDVAHYLQVEALKIGELSTRDRFGRSAYNRYYYSTFLQVRQMVSGMNAAWAHMPHADYPNLLGGQINKSVKNARRIAQKLSDTEFVSECNRALSALHALSALMQVGRATRVVADYQPEVLLVFGDNRFSLQGVNITEAHEWPEKSRQLIRTIEHCWAQIDA